MTDCRVAPQGLVASRGTPSGKGVINEHYTVTDKAVLANFNQLADEAMALDPGPRANRDRFLNLNKRPDKTLITDIASVKINGLDDRYVSPKSDVMYANRFAARAVLSVRTH